jgi:uncharacterized protein (UPF0248 family)
VNYFKFIESVQTLKQRVSEFADKLQAETLKLILLDQLIEIDVQELKYDAHVIPKHKVIEPVMRMRRIWMSKQTKKCLQSSPMKRADNAKDSC